MSLKQLTELYDNIQQLQEKYFEIVDANNGEITPEAEELEKQINSLISEKVKNVDEIYYMKMSFEKDIEMLQKLKQQITNKIRQKEEYFEKIKKFIAKIMTEDKLVGNFCSIKKRIAEELVITDKDKIPDEFFYEKVTKELNKNALKSALYNHNIEGAKLNKQFTITIYERGKNG